MNENCTRQVTPKRELVHVKITQVISYEMKKLEDNTNTKRVQSGRNGRGKLQKYFLGARDVRDMNRNTNKMKQQ